MAHAPLPEKGSVIPGRMTTQIAPILLDRMYRHDLHARARDAGAKPAFPVLIGKILKHVIRKAIEPFPIDPNSSIRLAGGAAISSYVVRDSAGGIERVPFACLPPDALYSPPNSPCIHPQGRIGNVLILIPPEMKSVSEPTVQARHSAAASAPDRKRFKSFAKSGSRHSDTTAR